MIRHYPLVLAGGRKPAYLLGFDGGANPTGLAKIQLRHSLEIELLFGQIQPPFLRG